MGSAFDGYQEDQSAALNPEDKFHLSQVRVYWNSDVGFTSVNGMRYALSTILLRTNWDRENKWPIHAVEIELCYDHE